MAWLKRVGEEDVFGRETGIKYRRWMEKSDGGSTKYWSHGGRGTRFYSGEAEIKFLTK